MLRALCAVCVKVHTDCARLLASLDLQDSAAIVRVFTRYLAYGIALVKSALHRCLLVAVFYQLLRARLWTACNSLGMPAYLVCFV